MYVCLTDEQELLRRSVREFAEAELRPHVREWDEAQQFPPALLSKFAELGLMGVCVPEEYGGAGADFLSYIFVLEEISRATAEQASERPIFNNAAQVWNHTFYWNCLAPKAGGNPTGAIHGTPSFREGKVARVEQWLASRGLSWADVKHSSFYSDSLNDLPLLEKVTEPVATNPDPRLSAIATERGWRILNLFE